MSRNVTDIHGYGVNELLAEVQAAQVICFDIIASCWNVGFVLICVSVCTEKGITAAGRKSQVETREAGPAGGLADNKERKGLGKSTSDLYLR